MQLNSDILGHFGASLVEPLGGRYNLHWLVEVNDERLVLRRWSQPADEVDYELRLLSRIAALGWPVAPALDGPAELEGAIWSLAQFLPGEPPSQADSIAEQRARGRLLAKFHADLAQLGDLGQRGSWRRCEEILGDSTIDRLLAEHEQAQPEAISIICWHLDRARERIAGLPLHDWPGIIVHGDFAAWNLRFCGGRLSGILDFELAHWDHQVNDFALSWRGKYDQVIFGYDEVVPLAPEEWELITPMWWAHLIECACYDLRSGGRDDGWTLRKLLQRSPLMGPDAAAFRT